MRSARHLPVHNRIEAVMIHVEWYWFNGVNRLAADIDVAPSTVSRLLRGQANPSFAVMWKIGQVLKKRLGKPIDLYDLVSLDGTYPTPSICNLCDCGGCVISNPHPGLDAFDPHIVEMRLGRWSFHSQSPSADTGVT